MPPNLPYCPNVPQIPQFPPISPSLSPPHSPTCPDLPPFICPPPPAKASRLSLPLPPLGLAPPISRWEAGPGPEGAGPEEEDDEEDAEGAGPEGAGPVVPLVVTCWDGRGLRGLLKAPRAPAEVRKRKMVSFFDDVTVYLFDQVSGRRGAWLGWGGRGQRWWPRPLTRSPPQETPTNELSCQSAAVGEESAIAPPDGLGAYSGGGRTRGED